MTTDPDETSSPKSTQLVTTRDGSHTVYSERFDQHFHNPNGAVSESRYVFFEQSGLLKTLKDADELTILEVGFGTGLNLMLLMEYYRELQSSARIHFHSIEGFPLGRDTAAGVNYDRHLNHPDITADVLPVFDEINPGYNTFQVTENITLHLFQGMFSEFNPEPVGANFIFHDAFSPGANPELWTGEVFQQLRRQSAGDVVLSTYCAASKARGAMAWAGWKVAREKGALGKREMTLAALDPDRLGSRKRINEERLARRYEDGDF